MSEHSFKAIQNFVSDLGEFFSSEIHSLALYERLINKTTLAHVEAVEKHIASFRKFLNENEDVIVNKQGEFAGIIAYSQKVFIDINEVMRLKMDDDTRNTIWEHLLTLLAIVCASTRARDILKADQSKASNGIVKFEGKEDEDDFLNSIISKVEKHVTPDTTNPQEAISSIMSSNMIPELVNSLNTGIASGKLDLSKMMSSVQKMVGNIAPDAQNDPNIANAMGMLTNMMSVMGNKTK
jgi:hypothetical protein